MMDKLTLALLAGAHAIESNKRLLCATYVYDVFGDSRELSYFEAIEILQEEAKRKFASKAPCSELSDNNSNT